MYPKLEECTLITNSQYSDLINPRFEGQTICDENNMYYMCWSSEGVMYKTHNKL